MESNFFVAEGRPGATEVVDHRGFCSYSALGLNIAPAPVLFSFIEGPRDALTSRIAVKLAMDAITTAAVELQCSEAQGRAARSKELIEAGFREANRAVYQYGAKMLSGGKVTATGIAFAFDGRQISVGRTGVYEAFLWRNGRLIRFYENCAGQRTVEARELLGRMIGAGKQILVDIASVKLEVGDIVVVTTQGFSETLFSLISHLLQERIALQALTERVVEESLRLAVRIAPDGGTSLERNCICVALQTVPGAIELSEVVV